MHEKWRRCRYIYVGVQLGLGLAKVTVVRLRRFWRSTWRVVMKLYGFPPQQRTRNNEGLILVPSEMDGWDKVK